MSKSKAVSVGHRRVKLSQIKEYSELLNQLTDRLRKQITSPLSRKIPPEYTSTQVASMCNIDRQRLNYLISKGVLPEGKSQGNGRSRIFTLKEAREWIKYESGIAQRPEGVLGKVLLCANFKGGSAKTTTSMCMAQGLSLRGKKILLIDLDPQASLTELCGLYADNEIGEDDTVLPFIYAPESNSLSSRIQKTYWDEIDVIASHPSLFSAEFIIPSMLSKDPHLKFWGLLSEGIDELRTEYDYIIIDSAPSLSYLTINSLMAADSITMPLVPESLDFISSVSFWNLFSDLTSSFEDLETDKEYDFISVLLSKVDNSPSSSSSVVRNWAKQAYSDWLEPVEIPLSSVMSNGALAISTVFDVGNWDGDKRTLMRIREPLESYCQSIDEYYAPIWAQEALNTGNTNGN